MIEAMTAVEHLTDFALGSAVAYALFGYEPLAALAFGLAFAAFVVALSLMLDRIPNVSASPSGRR